MTTMGVMVMSACTVLRINVYVLLCILFFWVALAQGLTIERVMGVRYLIFKTQNLLITPCHLISGIYDL